MMLVTVEGEEKMKALVEEWAGEKVMAEDQEEGGERLHAEKEEDACDADDVVESAEEKRPRWWRLVTETRREKERW